jgi:hypothetical protein
MYDDVRTSRSTEAALMEFMQSTYEAGAGFSEMDRALVGEVVLVQGITRIS